MKQKKETYKQKIIKINSIKEFRQSDAYQNSPNKVLYIDFKARRLIYEEVGEVEFSSRFSHFFSSSISKCSGKIF